jgi:alpha-L-fucosidase
MTSRRAFLASSAAALAASGSPARLRRSVVAPDRPRPSPSQLEWQRDELALFLHFGVNTFSDREWGDGKEDPAIFAPDALDARQWARTAKAAGFRTMILTTKHHDGFCLWPSRTTEHSVAKSSFRGGQGDVVREFTEACRAEGLKAGVYLSPWDRNATAYGDSARYNDMYRAQLGELLTQYGPIHEVWFDGANGEGPNGKRQVYDWPRVWALVRHLQPKAVMFSDAGPDVRWIGNETGTAGETNWSTVNPTVATVPGVSGAAVMNMLQHGDPNGSIWRPGETDVSIRPGWFYHPAEDTKVRSIDNLVTLYFTSVGRNSKLLLNVPPTRQGLLHEVDVMRLAGMRAQLDAMRSGDAMRGHRLSWHAQDHGGLGLVDLAGPSLISVAELSEDITHGQVVARYLVEGFDGTAWRTLSHGTTIGHRKLDRFTPTTVHRVRVTIEDAIDEPRPIALRLFTDPLAQ